MAKLIFALLFMVLWSAESIKEECIGRDIMVVLELKSGDGASAIRAKTFMENLIKEIGPSAGCNKLGFIFVGTQAMTVIDLNCNNKACYSAGKRMADKMILNAFKPEIVYDKTTVLVGMDMATKQLQPSGPNPEDKRKKLLILVQSNPPSSSGPNIASEVIDYLDFGLEIIAIGVGEGGNKNLDNIAIKKNFVIKVKSFTELSAKGAFLIQNALLPAVGYIYTKEIVTDESVLEEPTKEQKRNATLTADKDDFCTQIVDIGFIVDSSGSVKKYYEEEKFFVQRIAARFKIIEKGTHGGVILFSSHGFIKTMIRFMDYLTTDSFNEAVGNLPFYGYMTRIDKALELAHKELFSAEGKARPNVKKLLFLITDGKQNPNNIGGVPLDPAAEAEKLHLGKVQIYAVAVGSKVNLTELQLITKDPRKVYSVADFEELTSDAFVSNVSKQLCEGATQGTEAPFTINPPKDCNKATCKCGECGCCGKKPVYVNIFQGSNNYVSQGAEVTQTGSGNSAGAVGKSDQLHSSTVKGLSDQQIVDYIKTMLPYYDSMNNSLKELLARALKNKSSGGTLSKK